MTTANKTIKINDVEAAKKLVLSLDVEEPLELKYDGYDEDFESVIAGLAC